MKKILSLLLASSLVISSLAISAEGTIPGDLNADEAINAKDVTILRRHAAGGEDSGLDLDSLDLNKDGEISAKDVTLLRRYISEGWEAEIPNGSESNENIIDISTLSTSGKFTAAGYPETQSVLNFESGGDNSSTNHSIGVIDLSKYSKIIVTYGTDSTVKGDVTVVLKTRSSNLTSASFLPAKGWTDTTTVATFDVSAFSNNEELVLAMASNAFGFAVNKIELVEGDSGNTGSGELAKEDYVIDLTQLPTSGAFTAAGIQNKILNFNSGGTNSKSKHSIGNIDLSAYNTIRIKYSNDPNLSTVGTMAVYNSTSQIALASKFLKPSGGWSKFTEATIDISKVNKFEEIFLALEHESLSLIHI